MTTTATETHFDRQAAICGLLDQMAARIIEEGDNDDALDSFMAERSELASTVAAQVEEMLQKLAAAG